MARPRAFDEADVIAAARAQFRRAGYAATSLDDLSIATGLNRSSLYNAFGDKHGLFVRAFDEYCADAVLDARRALDGPDAGALDRIAAHLAAVADDTAADAARVGCFLASGVAERAAVDADVAALAEATLAGLEDALTDCVAAAQRAGELDPAADARALGALLLAVLRGIEAVGKGGRDPATLHAIAEAAVRGLPRPPDPPG